jgi:hypothetical protein
MKRTLLLPALLLASLLLPACGGGGGGKSTDPNLVAAAQCVSDGLANLDEIFASVSEFLASIGGSLPGGVTYDAGTGDFSITMSLGTIDGNVSSMDDISDGIDPGEAASAVWSLNPAVGMTVTGSGVFDLSRTTTTVFSVTGQGSAVDGTCALNATNVDLTLDLASSLGPVGSFDFDAATTTGAVAGTMSFDGSDTADVTATFGGIQVSFSIDLNTFVPVF